MVKLPNALEAVLTTLIQPVVGSAGGESGVEASVKQRLLIAALGVLRREPYSAFTQAEVATEAGVRQSHLTYYFPTRNDLLRAVVEAVKIEAMSQSPSVLPSLSQERGASLRALRKRVSAPADSPTLPRLMVALTTAADEDESLRPWLADCERDNKARLRAALASLGLRVEAAALDVFHATLIGAALLNFQQRTPAARRRAVRTCRMAFDRLVADALA